MVCLGIYADAGIQCQEKHAKKFPGITCIISEADTIIQKENNLIMKEYQMLAKDNTILITQTIQHNSLLLYFTYIFISQLSTS